MKYPLKKISTFLLSLNRKKIFIHNGIFTPRAIRIAFVILMVFFIMPANVFAATYYVDSVNGKNSNNGTLVNGTAWTTGHTGSALSFDGVNNRVDITGDTATLKPAHWTVSLWMYANTGSTKLRTIFSPAYSSGFASGFSLFVDSLGRIGIRYGNGTKFISSINSGTSILGGWHNVVATFDGTTMSLYVDDVLKDSMNASTFGYSAISNQARIGYGGGTDSFDGKLDEFRFYNRALTVSEIKALYADGNISSGLILHLPFDEDVGTATVDSSGNDGLSSVTPWRTLAKVSSSSFQSGDSILFKKGDVWHESLIVPSSGTVGNPITFGSYGSGNAPIIDGTSPVAGWSLHGGNIYVANVSQAVARVFVDNKFYSPAHYPNSGYETITSNSIDKASLTSTSFNPPSSDLVGAKVFVRTVPWRIEGKTVTAYDAAAHKINFVGNTYFPVSADYGFYLTNKLWMLNKPGEWYYDSSTGELYIWLLDGSNPNTHTISVADNSSVGISVSNKKYITIQDIEIRNTGSDGIRLGSVTNVLLQRLILLLNGKDGIFVNGATSDNLIFTKNTISKALEDSIKITFVPGSSTEISYNTISDTGNFGLPMKSVAGPMESVGGIVVNASNNVTVKNNTISRSNYSGILVSGDNNSIQNNSIDHSCLVLDDCGGIYHGSVGTGNRIVNNIITDSIGNYNGTPWSFAQAEGIYLDTRSHNTIISGNTVSNVTRGIYLHNSSANTVSNNTVYNARKNALLAVEDFHVATGTLKNNTITNNIFLNNSSVYPGADFVGNLGSIDFGHYNSNKYSSVFFGYPVSQQIIKAVKNYSLTKWKSVFSQDMLSTDIGTFFKVVGTKVNAYLASNFIINSTFDADISNWTKWSSYNSVKMNWVASCGLDTGCLHVTTDHHGSIISSNSFSLQAGTNYKVSFSTISNGAYSGFIFVRNTTTPWTVYGTKSFNMGNTRQDVSFTFKASKTLSNARIDFSTGVADYYIDNVSIRPVSLFKNNTSDDGVIYINKTLSNSTVNLGVNKYCSLNNSAVPGSFILSSFSSKVLLSCFNNNDRTCNNHETHDSAPLDCTGVNDEGAYAGLDAPYKIGVNKPDTSSSVRIYENGKYRYLSNTGTVLVMDFSVTPLGGSFYSFGTNVARPTWLDISNITWNTSGALLKEWTATGRGATTTVFTIGDLTPSAYYIVSVDNINKKTLQANGSGRISYTYSGGWSTHVFDVVLDTTSPAPSSILSPANNTSLAQGTTPVLTWSSAADTKSGLAKYQLYIDGSLAIDNIATTTTSASVPSSLSCNYYHSWYVRAVDNAGNGTDSVSRHFTTPCGTITIPVSAIVHQSQIKSHSISMTQTPSRDFIENTSTAIPNTPPIHVYSRNLTLGDIGVDVSTLQAFLISSKYYIPAGITGYFGMQTRAALAMYQTKHKIIPAVGYFGPITRASVKGGTSMPSTTKSNITVGTFYVFTKNLKLYDSGSEVKKLQHFLNTHGFAVASTGSGSLGNETNFFGHLTIRTLIKFQNVHADRILIPLGLSMGTGYFGPSTRTFVNKH